METRRLGRTDHQSSLAILGAAAFWDETPERTERAFDAALAAGVNHLDIAPGYAKAESLVGPLVPAVRDRLFVACKTGRTQPDGVRAQAEHSLDLLGCDWHPSAHDHRQRAATACHHHRHRPRVVRRCCVAPFVGIGSREGDSREWTRQAAC